MGLSQQYRSLKTSWPNSANKLHVTQMFLFPPMLRVCCCAGWTWWMPTSTQGLWSQMLALISRAAHHLSGFWVLPITNIPESSQVQWNWSHTKKALHTNTLHIYAGCLCRWLSPLWVNTVCISMHIICFSQHVLHAACLKIIISKCAWTAASIIELTNNNFYCCVSCMTTCYNCINILIWNSQPLPLINNVFL